MKSYYIQFLNLFNYGLLESKIESTVHVFQLNLFQREIY